MGGCCVVFRVVGASKAVTESALELRQTATFADKPLHLATNRDTIKKGSPEPLTPEPTALQSHQCGQVPRPSMRCSTLSGRTDAAPELDQVSGNEAGRSFTSRVTPRGEGSAGLFSFPPTPTSQRLPVTSGGSHVSRNSQLQTSTTPAQPNSERPFFFLPELARFLGVSTRTIQRDIAEGTFPEASGCIRCRDYWLKEVIVHWLQEGGSRSQ